MKHMPRVCGLLIVIGSVVMMPRSYAASDSEWVALRAYDTARLVASLEIESDVVVPDRTLVLLVLADRSINSSVSDAMDYLEQAEALLSAGTDTALVARSIRCQLEHRQLLPAARATCTNLIDLDVSTRTEFAQAFVHVTRMYFYYREGQHERSTKEAEKALAAATRIDDPALQAAAHNMLGLHFSSRLRPRMSLPHFESALEQAARLTYSGPTVVTQLNLASSYTYLGRSRESLQMLKEASQSSMVDLYDTRRLIVQSMIGHARASIGDTDGAEENLQRVMDEVRDTVLPDGMTFGYTGLGIIQLAEGRPLEALENFNKVLAITNKNFEDNLRYSRIQLVVVPYARALRQAGRSDEAQQLLERILAVVPESEPDQLLLDAYRELALTLDASGDAEGARVYAERATGLESRLWDASFQYQVARLNARLESDRKTFELERAREREQALRGIANRETTLRRQTLIIAAMLLAVLALMFSCRLKKRTVDAQRAASQQLEQQVQERTAELKKEMSKRMAVEVERRKLTEIMVEGERLRAMGQLTAGVAHDFNNLMTVVTLGVNQLNYQIDDLKGSEASETLNNIRSAADTGARITRGLLSYVREQPLQPETLSLDTFLEERLPIFRNSLGERITLRLELTRCRVLVDKSQLTTALLNLILNAKEAMPQGGHVLISLTRSNCQAHIKVQDSGLGMAPDILERATDPFFTTKQHEEGTGLGLSMVFGFAHQSQGDLAIVSEPGVGTTLTLSLPLSPDAVAEVASPKNKVPSTLKDIHVLAVDDRPALLHVLKRSLSRIAVKVTCVSSAADALSEVAKNGLPDLLVTDIVMPGDLDGIGLVAKLKQRDPDLPVILMSGYTREVDEDWTFLHKPFSFEQLEEAVDSALGQAQETVTS